MGCSSCASGGGTPKGCKSNGSCGVNGCEKLHVFDWLADINLPEGEKAYDLVEVRFKNGRKLFYRNTKALRLNTGDVIVVDGGPGFDVGVVSVAGELARIQLQRKDPRGDNHEVKRILRKAAAQDVQMWQEARAMEDETLYGSREVIKALSLNMKLSDVEFQADKSKAIFYYTADERVDFRELIKKLADKFKIRIEMRQIGARQEAGRLGGIGSCGRELCCSTWLTDFRTVSTNAARYQQLSINPQKLAGQCGKLKCCLNYELDMYMEAAKVFPDTNIKLETERGTAVHFKTDIFKKNVWYIYREKGDSPMPIPLERVDEIIAMNKRGKKPADLKDFALDLAPKVVELDYENAEGEDSITRFDKKKKRPSKRNSNSKQGQNTKGKKPGGNKPQGQGNKPKNKPQGRKPSQPGKPANKPKKGPSSEAKNSGEAPKKPNPRRKPNRRTNNKPNPSKES